MSQLLSHLRALEWLQLNATDAVVLVKRNHFEVYRGWRDMEDGIVWAEAPTMPEAVKLIRDGGP